MALKDWKKLTDTAKAITFASKKANKYMIIDKKKYSYTFKYGLEIYSIVPFDRIDFKWFKTKSQALKFAKEYMRKY